MAEQEAFLKAHDEQEQREEELAEQSGGAEGSSESPDDENFEAGEGDLPAVEEVGGMVPSVSEDDDEGGQPSGSGSRSEDPVSGLYDDDDGYAADAAGEPIAQGHDDGQRGNEPVSDDEDSPSEAGADAQQEPRHGDSQEKAATEDAVAVAVSAADAGASAVPTATRMSRLSGARMPMRAAIPVPDSVSTCGVNTRFKKSSSAGRSCWCRFPRKSAETRAQRLRPIFRL